MGVHESVIVVKGERLLSHVSEILGMFGYQDLGKDRIVRKPEELEELMDAWDLGEKKSRKAVTTSAGWVMIYDPESALSANAQGCAAVSRKFETQVFGMKLDSASDTYAFSLHDKGAKIRDFHALAGKLERNDGRPLSNEIGLNLKGLQGLDEKLTTVMLGLTGVDLYTVLENNSFTVKEVVQGGVVPSGAEPAERSASSEKKPGWKFWK